MSANPPPRRASSSRCAPTRRPAWWRSRCATPVAAFGSPGGATIINSVYNVLINLVDHGMSIKQAVEAPRISVTTAGNSIAREAGFDPAEIAKLQALGHTVGNPNNIGNVNAVFIDLATGRAFGAVDSTRDGGLIGIPQGRDKKDHD